MSQQHKILFFVNNLTLLTNWVLKLSPYLINCEILALHNSSMHPGYKPKELPIKNIDISCLTYQEIKQILDDFSPEICILFNFRGVIDQFFIRICKQNQIQSIFLEHGILSKDVLTFKEIKTKNLSLRVKRVTRQFRQYLSLIIHSPEAVNEFKLFIKVLLKNKFSLNPFDKYLLYGDRCFNYLANVYNLKKGMNAYLVGYPLFDSDLQKQKALNHLKEMNKEGVLYVHQPFILDNYTQISYEQEKIFITKLAENLTTHYGKFTLLLHPRESLIRYQQLYTNTNINIMQSPNDYRLFASSSLVLGHYSTALLFSLYFDIPTFIIDYPSLLMPNIFTDVFPHVDMESLNKNTIISNMSPNKEYLLGKGNTFENISRKILQLL